MIESVSFAGGPSVTIKSHHNVGGLPARGINRVTYDITSKPPGTIEWE